MLLSSNPLVWQTDKSKARYGSVNGDEPGEFVRYKLQGSDFPELMALAAQHYVQLKALKSSRYQHGLSSKEGE